MGLESSGSHVELYFWTIRRRLYYDLQLQLALALVALYFVVRMHCVAIKSQWNLIHCAFE